MTDIVDELENAARLTAGSAVAVSRMMNPDYCDKADPTRCVEWRAAETIRSLRQQVEGWQPIETAPKDTTTVDLWMAYYDEQNNIYTEERRTDCHYHSGAWHDGKVRLGGGYTRIEITHWRPILGPGGKKCPFNYPDELPPPPSPNQGVK